MTNIEQIKKDIILATTDEDGDTIEVFGEPTEELNSVAVKHNVSYDMISELWYELLEGN